MDIDFFFFLNFWVLQRLEVAEFSGLRSNASVTYATYAREGSFFDVVAAQLTPKVIDCAFSNFFNSTVYFICSVESNKISY